MDLSLDSSAAVLMSGGIDSTACLHFLAKRGGNVQGVLLDYGQAAAARERQAARALAAHMHVPLVVYDVRGGPTFGSGELKGRNAFLIFAALFLTRLKSGLVAIGVHAGSPYYDCSPPFIDSMAQLIADDTDGQIKLIAPFLTWSKGDVFQYFVTSGLPIGLTYSCEAGAQPPCGVCMSCRDRRALGC
jgi:7-cyano-7-deazaguanine synthase